MSRDERKKAVLNSLLELDPNKDYFYNKIKYHLNSSNPEEIYSAPINPLYLQPLDIKHSIVLEENVYDALMTIDQYNIQYKKEVPFILYGYESKGGAIVFDDIYCDLKKLQEAEATFENLSDFLHRRMQVFYEDDMKNKVICLGHTHPFTGKISYNYSIADLCCHLFYFEYDIFSNSYYNNKVFSLMKSISTDFNFIYYDDNDKLFKKVSKVYLRQKKKEFILLDSFKNCDD
jgi:hypothetical protein